MNTTQNRAAALVDGHHLGNLCHNGVPAACFVFVAGNDPIAMHTIALPYDGHSTVFDCLDVAGQHGLSLSSAVASDKHEPTLFLVGIQNSDQLFQLVILHRGTDFHTDGVCNSPEVLNVRAVKLSGAVTNPDQVRAEIVELGADRSGQRLLKIKLHRLMGCEELRGLRRNWLEANRTGIFDVAVVVLGSLELTHLNGLQRLVVTTSSVAPEVIQRG
mmetsp:Transcript_146911/g.208274  ORF Transcript_146911/g.208274 Transcript_146911/m.208274 type:complete len:216 (+) Transcript_146911:365-1012(+)